MPIRALVCAFDMSIVPAALLLQQVADVLALVERVPRRWLVAATLVLVIAGVIGVTVARRPTTRWSAVRAIGHAKVERGTPPTATPCDFFNPRWGGKWECAQLDREPWQTWGLAVNDQCKFKDAKEPQAGQEPWLWLHPNPGSARRIVFDHVPAGRLRLRYGLAPLSHASGLKFAVTTGTIAPRAYTIGDIGVVHTETLPQSGSTLMVEVPEQVHDWRQLCVQLDVLP